jgi:hypothetical protein
MFAAWAKAEKKGARPFAKIRQKPSIPGFGRGEAIRISHYSLPSEAIN